MRATARTKCWWPLTMRLWPLPEDGKGTSRWAKPSGLCVDARLLWAPTAKTCRLVPAAGLGTPFVWGQPLWSKPVGQAAWARATRQERHLIWVDAVQNAIWGTALVANSRAPHSGVAATILRMVVDLMKINDRPQWQVTRQQTAIGLTVRLTSATAV
jgi:hypothetical protein